MTLVVRGDLLAEGVTDMTVGDRWSTGNGAHPALQHYQIQKGSQDNYTKFTMKSQWHDVSKNIFRARLWN